MRFSACPLRSNSDREGVAAKSEQNHCAPGDTPEPDPGGPERRHESMHERGRAPGGLRGLRLAGPTEPAEQPAQVVRRGRDQVTLPHIDQAAQPPPRRPAGVADVRERPLAHFAPPPLQGLTLGPPDPATIAVHRPPQLRRLVGPPRPTPPAPPPAPCVSTAADAGRASPGCTSAPRRSRTSPVSRPRGSPCPPPPLR